MKYIVNFWAVYCVIWICNFKISKFEFCFLRSKRWETRIAAAGALSSILKEVPAFKPSALKEEDEIKRESKDDYDDYR